MTGGVDRQAEVFRVFEALRELVGLVENARAVPLSASCVVPRDHVLDLLDDIHGSLPAELDDAQAVISAQDELLARARDRVERAAEKAEAARERALAQARAEVAGMLAAAQQEAERIVADARAEHDRLVAETEVHQAAEEQARQLVVEAREEARRLTTESGEQARTLLAESREQAEQLRAEADEYVSARLSGLADTLTRTLRTVEKGRQSLRGRVPPAEAGSDHPDAGPRDRPVRLSRGVTDKRPVSGL